MEKLEEIKSADYFVNTGDGSVVHLLWEIYHESMNWVQNSSIISLKPLDNKNNTHISFQFYIINNVKVCFIYSDSMIVDHNIIDKFLLDNIYGNLSTKKAISCNTENFTQCLNFIKEKQ